MKPSRTRRRSHAKRARVEMAPGAIAFSICVAAAAYCSFAVTSAQVIRNNLPEQALRLNPFDPLAPALAVERRLTKNYKVLSTASTRAALRDALALQPANPRAVRLMGYTEDVAGHQTKAAQILALAQGLSRRDAGTQLWLLEDAVRRNDVAAVLQHYDRMLRTSNDSRNVLFPIMTNALKNEEVRLAFAKYIKAPPPWLSTYLSFAILEGSEPTAIADAITVAGGLPKTETFAVLNAQLLDRLVAANQFVRARLYYLSLPDRRASELQSLALMGATTTASNGPFAWQPATSGSSGAEINLQPRRPVMRVFGTSGETVPVARKMLFLPPASYSLSFQIAATEVDSDGAIGLVIGCKSGKEDLVLLETRFPLIEKQAEKSAFFSVPATCAAEFLTIQAIGGLSEQGMEAELSNFKLERR